MYQEKDVGLVTPSCRQFITEWMLEFCNSNWLQQINIIQQLFYFSPIFSLLLKYGPCVTEKKGGVSRTRRSLDPCHQICALPSAVEQ